MGLKEQVLVAAEQVLKDTPEGMTAEALARQVAKAVEEVEKLASSINSGDEGVGYEKR